MIVSPPTPRLALIRSTMSSWRARTGSSSSPERLESSLRASRSKGSLVATLTLPLSRSSGSTSCRKMAAVGNWLINSVSTSKSPSSMNSIPSSSANAPSTCSSLNSPISTNTLSIRRPPACARASRNWSSLPSPRCCRMDSMSMAATALGSSHGRQTVSGRLRTRLETNRRCGRRREIRHWIPGWCDRRSIRHAPVAAAFP